MGQTCEELVVKAWEALEEENYDEAEALARRALMADPRSVEARLGAAHALMNKEDYRSAIPLLEEAAALARKDPEIETDLGIALFETCQFSEAKRRLAKALKLGACSADAFYWMGLSLERAGQLDAAEAYFEKAHENDPESCARPYRISREECESAVEEARSRLPAEFDHVLENVAIRVEDLPDETLLTEQEPPLDPCLLGLFVGTPIVEKAAVDPSPQMPDTILIFQRNLERSCGDHDSLVEEIFTTLYHEIGHLMGYDDEELATRGWA